MVPTLPIQITCPKCGTRYVAQVHSIVDAGQEPALKAALLRGRLNTVSCPSCGAVGAVSTPLLYHDPKRDLLLLFIPPELNMGMPEREKLTGSLLNALMATVPAEARRAYFLNPRPMLTMQGLIEEILKADGITKEMLEEQQARSRLLQDLLVALDDPVRLKALIEEHRTRIDYRFLVTLAAAAESSAAAGQNQVAERLLKLQDAVLQQVPMDLPEPLPPDTPPEQMIDRLLAAQDEEVRMAWVLYNRPLLDYVFFQQLTQRLEKAPPEQADALRKLRSELLEITAQLDKEAQAVQEAKIRLLQEALQNPDPAQVLRPRKDEVDSLFLAILGSALQDARHRGDLEQITRLQSVNDATLRILQEELPPELRLINSLLAAEYPQGTEKALQEHRGEWDANLPQMLSDLADDLQQSQRPEAAQHLRSVRQQAEAILQQPAAGSPAS